MHTYIYIYIWGAWQRSPASGRRGGVPQRCWLRFRDVYTTILLYYCTTILLYYYTTILLYYYATILLYCCTTILDVFVRNRDPGVLSTKALNTEMAVCRHSCTSEGRSRNVAIQQTRLYYTILYHN